MNFKAGIMALKPPITSFWKIISSKLTPVETRRVSKEPSASEKLSPFKSLLRQSLKSINILFTSLRDDFGRQFRRRTIFVPSRRFQPLPYELFVKRQLIAARLILVCWPKPRTCLLYTSPSPRDQRGSRMPSSA